LLRGVLAASGVGVARTRQTLRPLEFRAAGQRRFTCTGFAFPGPGGVQAFGQLLSEAAASGGEPDSSAVRSTASGRLRLYTLTPGLGALGAPVSASEQDDPLPNKGLQQTTNSYIQSFRGTILASGGCASALAVSAVRCS